MGHPTLCGRENDRVYVASDSPALGEIPPGFWAWRTTRGCVTPLSFARRPPRTRGPFIAESAYSTVSSLLPRHLLHAHLLDCPVELERHLVVVVKRHGRSMGNAYVEAVVGCEEQRFSDRVSSFAGSSFELEFGLL
jgi:hypothetical protein